MDKQELIDTLETVDYGAVISLSDGREVSVLRQKGLLKMETCLGWLYYSESQLANELITDEVQVLNVEVC